MPRVKRICRGFFELPGVELVAENRQRAKHGALMKANVNHTLYRNLSARVPEMSISKSFKNIISLATKLQLFLHLFDMQRI